jgi:hypothetical protein
MLLLKKPLRKTLCLISIILFSGCAALPKKPEPIKPQFLHVNPDRGSLRDSDRRNESGEAFEILCTDQKAREYIAVSRKDLKKIITTILSCKDSYPLEDIQRIIRAAPGIFALDKF